MNSNNNNNDLKTKDNRIEQIKNVKWPSNFFEKKNKNQMAFNDQRL